MAHTLPNTVPHCQMPSSRCHLSIRDHKRLLVYVVQGRRNVFTTGPAKFDIRTMQLNAWVADNFMNIEILFLPLILP